MSPSRLSEHKKSVIIHRTRIEQAFLDMLDSLALAEDVGDNSAQMPLSGSSLGNEYTLYAQLLAPLFPEISATAALEIDLAIGFYEEYYLLLNQGVTQQQHLKATYLLQESLGILYRYFPQPSYFWFEFERHQEEYTRAVLLTSKLQGDGMKAPFDSAVFERVAAGKAALAKCALAALAILADRPEQLETLYALFDNLAIFKHLYQDVKAWQRDFQQRHFTFLLQRFATELGSIAEMKTLALDERRFKLVFFTSQALRTAIDGAQERLEKVIQAPTLAHCTLWLKDLRKLHQVVLYHKDGIYHMVRQQQQARSRLLRGSSLEKALWFLSAAQDADGTWSSFYLLTNTSSAWVTGYVANVLLEHSITQSVVEKAASWLMAQRFPEGGWGYQRTATMDGDSTATSLSFLAGRLSLEETQRAIEALLTFQQADGGFSLYTQAQANETLPALILSEPGDFAEECTSLPCVTAAALCALCQLCQHNPQLTCENAIAQAVNYLIQQQQGDGCWQSNRWHGTIYTTAMVLQALAMAQHGDEQQAISEASQRGQAFLLCSQLPGGAWRLDESSAPCPFQTALALLALAGYSEGTSRLADARSYLQQAQQPDGSWRAVTGMMRFPSAATSQPLKHPDRPQADSSASTLDSLHVFTTATVLRALSSFDTLPPTAEPQEVNLLNH